METSILIVIVVIIILALGINFIISSGSFPAKLKKILQAYKEEKYDIALKEINSLDSRNKKDPTVMWILANIYYKQQHYILAMVSLQNIIDGALFTKDVTEIDVREMLAHTYEETGNAKKAVDEYEMIVRLNEHDFDSLYKAGLVCYNYGEWPSAQKYLSEAITQNDSNPQVAFLLADCYYKMHSFHAAQQNIEKAILLDGSEPVYHLLYGKILYAERDFQNAARELETTYNNTFESKDETTLTLANTYYELGDYNKARKYYSEVLTREDVKTEKVIDERYKYAETLVKNKQFEAAVEQWNIIKSLRSIYLDVDQKLKTYGTIINNAAFRTALEMDIVEYLEKHLYRILTLNGYVVTDHTKKSDTLVFFLTIKKFGSEGQSYKSTFALDTSGYPMRQETVNQFIEYARVNKSAHSFLISIGGFAINLKTDENIMVIEPERFEAIMEGVISFNN